MYETRPTTNLLIEIRDVHVWMGRILRDQSCYNSEEFAECVNAKNNLLVWIHQANIGYETVQAIYSSVTEETLSAVVTKVTSVSALGELRALPSIESEVPDFEPAERLAA